jgi:phosphoribosylanthranilate isomerase
LVFSGLVVARTRIKICGITRPEDARTAIDSGADALGLVFYPKSPRSVSLEQARAVAAVVPPFVSLVTLFVNESEESISRVLQELPVGMIQFHGDESPEFCSQFQRPWIKALRVSPGIDLKAEFGRFQGACGLLLDAFQEGVPGGTGKTFDWSLAQADMPRPWVLAGGLNAQNVGEAVRRLGPAAVDVSGGVEASPGIKCPEKINEFVAAVRAADL